MRYYGQGPEIRSVTEDGHVEGYAIVYGQWSELLGTFRERVQRGAVHTVSNLRALVNHDSGKLLASVPSGTLVVEDRPEGLWMRAKLPDTSYARDLRALMSTGMMGQQSFAFSVRRSGNDRGDVWEQRDGGVWRTLTSIDVEELSIVADPAYTQTSAHLRSSAEAALAEYRSIGAGRQRFALDLDLAEKRFAALRRSLI